MSYGNEYSKKIYEKTKKYQKIYNFELGKGEHDTWNNESDAFKHTFGSAEMSLTKGGTNVSKTIGDFHEWQGRKGMGQSPGEENMDKWNNAEGRKIAQEIREESKHRLIKRSELDDIIASKVMKKMKNGELITHPNDQRKYDDRTPAQKFDDEIRAKYKQMKNSKLQKVFGKSKSNSSSGNGRWVTINGAHVYIE